MLMLGLGKKGGVVENRERKNEERYPGTGCGLSGKEIEGHYLPLTQAWLGPIPLYPRHQRNSIKIREKKEVESEGLERMTECHSEESRIKMKKRRKRVKKKRMNQPE